MSPSETNGSQSHLRVVIVDDDEALRTLLGLQLADYPMVRSSAPRPTASRPATSASASFPTRWCWTS